MKFKKFAQADFRKIVHNFSNNMLFIAYTEDTATYSHRMEPKLLSPLATYCPITGPSPHMRQLLDSSTWHQQQLIQLAAFLTPHTQWFISQLELTVSSQEYLKELRILLF